MAKKPSKTAAVLALHQHLKGVMRSYRESRGWSQAYIAKLLGISKANYEKYEGEEPDKPLRKIPLDVLVDFCDLAGFSMDELTRGTPRKRA